MTLRATPSLLRCFATNMVRFPGGLPLQSINNSAAGKLQWIGPSHSNVSRLSTRNLFTAQIHNLSTAHPILVSYRQLGLNQRNPHQFVSFRVRAFHSTKTLHSERLQNLEDAANRDKDNARTQAVFLEVITTAVSHLMSRLYSINTPNMSLNVTRAGVSPLTLTAMQYIGLRWRRLEKAWLALNLYLEEGSRPTCPLLRTSIILVLAALPRTAQGKRLQG